MSANTTLRQIADYVEELERVRNHARLLVAAIEAAPTNQPLRDDDACNETFCDLRIRLQRADAALAACGV